MRNKNVLILIDLTSTTFTVFLMGITVACLYPSYVLTKQGNIHNDSTLDSTIVTESTVASSDIEDTAIMEVQEEAKAKPRLTIDNDFVDPENHCDFCTRIELAPGKGHVAGIAYRNDNME
jgi:hypothetical protein